VSLERGAPTVDAERLRGLMRRLGLLEERERLLVRLRQDHYRAEANLERSLSVPVSPLAEADRRSNLLQDMRALSEAAADGIDAELSDLEAERQDLFSRMSEEGMREGLWVRNPLNRRTGITLYGSRTSRRLWKAPWRAARNAPDALSPPEVAGYATYLSDRLLRHLKRSITSLVVALVSSGGAYALAQSPPQSALGSFFGAHVLPLVAWTAFVVFAVGLLVYLPVSLYGFCRPGAFMRRRDYDRAERVPNPGGRGDPSLHGGPRNSARAQDDTE
jgi:hypothetical protein